MNKNIKVKIQSMPLWQNDMSIKTLDGGLTNENFLIENKDKKYVVRLGNDIPEHLKDNKEQWMDICHNARERNGGKKRKTHKKRK